MKVLRLTIQKTSFICSTCNELMIESNNKDYIDGICLRFRKKNPKNDIKISIGIASFLGGVKIELISIFFYYKSILFIIRA